MGGRRAAMTYEQADQILKDCKHVSESPTRQTWPGGRVTEACVDCWNAHVYARRQARREQLAQCARCEVPGCKARGSMIVCGSVLMCGRHLKAANRNRTRQLGGGFAYLGLFGNASASREELLKLAGAK